MSMASSGVVLEKKVPFLIPDLEELRGKIGGLQGIWAKRWAYFLQTAREHQPSKEWYAGDSRDVPMHAVFSWLVTGEKFWEEKAAAELRWTLETYEHTLSREIQEHDTWIHAAAFTRKAIALDWMWASDCLSDKDREELVDLLITDSLKYPYVVLHHRVPAHANNQGLAQALNLVVVGYLFGVKHGRDVRARHLLEFGLGHLMTQVAYLRRTVTVGREAPIFWWWPIRCWRWLQRWSRRSRERTGFTHPLLPIKIRWRRCCV
ncbi:MAG: hypothetical protein HC904_10070 [Blastochloris sp.]|nr:hypothetical protein [Blastochloris sp.]